MPYNEDDLLPAEWLEATAITLFKTPVAWKRKLAQLLDVPQKRVGRWAARGVPPWVFEVITEKTGTPLIKNAMDVPYNAAQNHDKWVCGEGHPLALHHNQRAYYIIHNGHPRFIARIADDGDTADRVSGITYKPSDDTLVICEISWLDDAPHDTDAMFALLKEAYEVFAEWFDD